MQQPTPDKNVCSAEKMTQTNDGSIWQVISISQKHRFVSQNSNNDSKKNKIKQVNLPQQNLNAHTLSNVFADCSDLSLNEAMTCQELLAFSVAFSAALPTSQTTLESFYTTLAKQNDPTKNSTATTVEKSATHVGGQNVCSPIAAGYYEDYACCFDLYQNATLNDTMDDIKPRNKFYESILTCYKVIDKISSYIRRYVRLLVDHKYFQQGILLAILINTLSMGIEYHNQPEELTAIVETSNVAFSAIFAVEMLLKVIAEGPFKYIANGFNVFDGIIVILR